MIIGQLAQRGIIPASNARLRFGTAGALAVGILNVNVRRNLSDNPAIAPELIGQVGLE